MDYLVQARHVFDLEVEELQAAAQRLDGAFVSAVESLVECAGRGGKVVIVGVGKSGHIGEKIAATLTSTGSQAVVLNPLNALHGDLGVVSDGDVILAMSHSGETPELLNILEALERFRVKIVAMTGTRDSALARRADVTLDTSISREACPLNLAPTSSTTLMLVMGDALAMTLLEARGFQKENFAKFHPGGSLGRSLLLKVDQIMRPREEMALIAPETTIAETLRAMTRARVGAAVVIDPEGKLEGIFTHGDFARRFSEMPDIAEKPVSAFMTRNPITIHSGKLAAEVLQILQHHRVDDLVIVDEAKRPVGLVDAQDLARAKMF